MAALRALKPTLSVGVANEYLETDELYPAYNALQVQLRHNGAGSIWKPATPGRTRSTTWSTFGQVGKTIASQDNTLVGSGPAHQVQLALKAHFLISEHCLS